MPTTRHLPASKAAYKFLEAQIFGNLSMILRLILDYLCNTMNQQWAIELQAVDHLKIW